MAFRADEAAQNGFDRAEAYLVPRPKYADEAQRERSRQVFSDLVRRLGPVVDAYPTWHPLVRNNVAENDRHGWTTPGPDCGYKGLDHTIYFAHGFVTCPYNGAEEVLESALNQPWHPAASITAERLEEVLYNPDAQPVVVECKWAKPLEEGMTIPLSVALPLLLEKELPCWHWSSVGETWETMRTSFLGEPHGARSSLFVTQETGQALKKIWTQLVFTGMYGPVMV